MNAEAWSAIQEIFESALARKPEERSAFLDQACHEVSWRDEVGALLAEHDSLPTGFMSTYDGAEAERQDSATATPDPRIGKNIGRYQVRRVIGRGGMGTVYLAVDTKLDRQVAIKLLPHKFEDDLHRRELLEREARTAAQLNHPNVATIYEFAVSEDSYFIAMEYVEGHLLSDLRSESQRRPLSKLLDIAVQIAKGLSAAHDHHIVHRDLKPANLMITGEGLVKILDFGLAKALPDEAPGTTSSAVAGGSVYGSTVFGTPGYSSPEQCSNKYADFRSDLFSFGVVLYELTTGIAPFTRETFKDTIKAVKEEHPAPSSVVNRDIPVDFSRLIQKLLAKRPEDRYQSSSDVLTELQKLQRINDQPWRGRLRMAAFATIALVALLAIVASFLQETITLKRLQRELREACTYGHLEVAHNIVDEICRDIIEVQCEEAHAQYVTAVGWRETTTSLNRSIQSSSRVADWVTAQLDLARLRALGKDYYPASIVAASLTESLLGDVLIREMIGGQTRNPPRIPDKPAPPVVDVTLQDSQIVDPSVARPSVDTEPILGILPEEAEPQDSDAEAEAAPLEREGQLQELRDAAKPGMSSKELSGLLRKMEDIDPDSTSAIEVRAWRDLRHQQEERYRAGIVDFADQSQVGISKDIREYEVIALRSPEADAELERLREAERWLGRFNEASDRLNDDFPLALAIQTELRSNSLSLDFRDALTKHLASLSSAMEQTQARLTQDVGDLIDEIDRLCTDRQPRQARSKLLELQSLTRGFDWDISGAMRRVEQLEHEEQLWQKLDRDYADFRGQLKEGAAGVEQLLRELEDGWKELKSHLDKALAIRQSDELMRRRALVNMRLGSFSAAQSDAERLHPSAERLLLLSEATFAQAPGETGAIMEALSHVDAASNMGLDGEQSGRASYLQFAYLEALANPDPQTQELLERAAKKLQEAVEKHSLNSADASYRLSTLHFVDGNNAEAIKFATRAIDAPLTEDGVIVALGGNHAAADGGAARTFRRDAFLRRAQGQFMIAIGASRRGKPSREGFLLCIDDCTTAIELDGQHALSYFLRGFANGEAAQYDQAVQDLDLSLKLVDEHSDDPNLAQVKNNAPILSRRYRERSK